MDKKEALKQIKSEDLYFEDVDKELKELKS